MSLRTAATVLLTLTAALLWAGEASADGPLALERRTAFSLTISWSWSGQPASAYELAWRARSDDSIAAWRSLRKTAAQRRHTIDWLNAGVHYIIRVRPLDPNDRPFASLQGSFATSSAAAGQRPDPRLRRGLTERLTLELESSRELCTAGTLTEISWQISGGKPPYKLQVEGSPVNADADNIRINCGALSGAEAADEEAALAAKQISAVVTDARGVRREAALDVARARALPAPTNVRYSSSHRTVLVLWDEVAGAGSQSPRSIHPVTRSALRTTAMVRTRANGDATWRYEVVDREGHNKLGLDALPGTHEFSVAVVRHPLEVETPTALNWSDALAYTATKPAPNVTLTATHDTVTVSWDRQPLARHPGWNVELLDVEGGGMRSDIMSHRMISDQSSSSARHAVNFTHLPPDTVFNVRIYLNLAEHEPAPAWMASLSSEHPRTVRTKPAPPDWTPWPVGAQNLQTTATDDSITISWDAPSDSAADRWFVELHDTASERLVYARWAYLSESPLTINRLLPTTTYRITVEHIDLQTTTTTATVTTSATASANGPLTLERRTASTLTISWSWSGQPASAYEIAWRVRGDDDPAAWRSLRKTAAQRRHTIDGLDAGVHYVIRVRPLDPNDRPFASLQGSFATSSAAAGQRPDPRLLRGLAERLRLELEGSREFCTAGTLTEISWQISGGKPPYKLQVEGAPITADADSIRINCGALTETEAADEEAALAAKRVTATVTDSRGVRQEAAIEVARARALPAPTRLSYGSHFETVLVGVEWSEAGPNLSADAVARYRPIGGAEWSYSAVDDSVLTLKPPPGEHTASIAAVRHALEAETPEALNWSEELRFARTVAPQNLVATATHDTVTVAWDKQPYTNQMPSVRLTTTSNRDGSLSERVYEEDGEYGRHEVAFKHVLPDTEYVVTIIMSDLGTLVPTSTTVRTMAAPAGWVPPPRGPQNLRATATHDSITVTWEHPHDTVRAPYIVELLDAHSGALLNHTWVSTQTSWTGRALNGAALRPGKQYRIRVKLMTFTLPTVEVVVRVPAAQDENAEQ